MALHIRDPKVDRLVRDLAAQRGIGLTRAIELAVSNELKRPSLYERIRPIRERSRAAGARAMSTDKTFFDALNDE